MAPSLHRRRDQGALPVLGGEVFQGSADARRQGGDSHWQILVMEYFLETAARCVFRGRGGPVRSARGPFTIPAEHLAYVDDVMPPSRCESWSSPSPGPVQSSPVATYVGYAQGGRTGKDQGNCFQGGRSAWSGAYALLVGQLYFAKGLLHSAPELLIKTMGCRA